MNIQLKFICGLVLIRWDWVTFDVETQLSTEQVKKINIIPNVANKFLEESRQSFLKYIAQKTVVFAKNSDLIFSRIDENFNKAVEAFHAISSELKHSEPEELFCNSELLKSQLLDYSLVEFGSTSIFAKDQIVYNTTPQPSFNKKFN